MKIVTSEAMRELEKRADSFGLSSPVLMQLAGLAVADETARALGCASGRRALVLAGPGNNGGDGLVAASRLHDWGAEVVLYLWKGRLEGDGNYALCLKRGIRAVTADSDSDLEKLRALLLSADVVVDALLGIGLARPVAGDLEKILKVVEAIRQARLQPPEQLPRPYLVALDVPTGLYADSGNVDPSCFTADLTITLGFPKVGLLIYPGAGRVGRLITRDIGIPHQLAEDMTLQLLTADYVRGLLPFRPADANKGTFGRVLVVGGSQNYIGAPCLASMGALRAGAGLVTVAMARSLYSILTSKLSETTFLPLPEAEEGALGVGAVQPVLEALQQYSVLCIGPGLGRHPDTARFVRETLKGCPSGVEVVVDADGLNALAEDHRWWEGIKANVVLTPHPGEMSRLIGKPVHDVIAERLEVARGSAAEWRSVILLKGANTLIASPQGNVNVNPMANPALASAGTGDVLAGVIAGLLAQGSASFEGASAGAYVHALAGEALRSELGEAGVIASDLLGAIPKALKSIKEVA